MTILFCLVLGFVAGFTVAFICMGAICYSLTKDF